MNKLKILFVALSVLSITHLANAQEKYAVLITGDYAATSYGVPLSDQWNGGQGKSTYGFDEFWNDTFLMWEMLQEKGYSQDNIIVLFADGNDFTFSGQAPQYKPNPGVTVTDYSASIANVNLVFNGLANGTGGFPQVTQDDFLFVWTFDHGGGSGGNSTLYLIDGLITDDDFAALTNPIAANKKVYWMQQCRSGGFADELEGTTTFFHSACQPDQNAYRANNTPDLENEVINGVTYHHGEFNFHIYSPTNGSSPAGYTSYNGEPYSNADLNSDNYISMHESWVWESTHENSSETPLLSDLGSIGEFTSLDYPTLLHLNITDNESHRGLIGVSKDVHIVSGKQLQLISNADVHLLNDADLIVDAGATLIIEDNVTISGNNSNQIIVNGNIQIGQNVTFNKHGSTGFFTGLLLNNSNMQTNIDNVTFNEAYLTNYGAELEIINSNFNDCRWVFSHNGDITIDNCTFNETWLFLENMQNDPDMLARVYNSTFNNINVVVGLDMYYYHDYWIENNNIRAKYNGVQIHNCGIDNFTTQHFLNNTIHDCNWAGILAYSSNGSFAKNHIYDNKVGIKLFNKSNFSFLGNPSASNNVETNFITDNDSYEVYISKYSFPWYFRYNSIIDEDNGGNPGDPLIYFAYPAGGKVNQKDIRYNCWGSNFLDSEDLYPHTYFSWNPTWCPGSGFGEIDIAEQMYTDANTQIELQQYSEAKIIFKQLVDLYPESEYAVSAMKEMLRLEKFVTNDYNSLKEYYITDNTIQTDTILRELGASLANDCNIKLENWPDAIEYYESTISESPTLEDSVFAIIDLGYTYFLMENAGDKSAYVGKLAQFKPESKEKFFDHRDYLLSLLPVDNISEAMKGNIASLSEGELLQNVPNPFRESTQIWYKLESEATVQLNIFNYTGQLVSTINEGTRPEGIHQIDFNAEGLPNGIYFYSISINGQTTDSKKMTIMK
jgi:tetratricopeptide (TPR) repeat protein